MLRNTFFEDRLLFTTVRTALTLLLAASAASLYAQAPSYDVAVTYTAQHSLKASSTQSFWSQGGSAQAGADLWHGLGLAVDVTGTHAASIGSSGVPLSLVTTTAGPRYRHSFQQRISVYGEALAGNAHGFDSLFPSGSTSTSSANSIAVQLGGGIDLTFKHHLGIRLLNAGWLHTELPNGSNNLQNNLYLGAGLVMSFGR